MTRWLLRPFSSFRRHAGKEQKCLFTKISFSNPLSNKFVLLFLGDEWVILAWKPSLSKG